MEISWPKVIGAGIVFGIIAQIFHTIESFFTMNFYTMPDYFSVWSKIMMPAAGPPPMSFYYTSIVFAIVTGIVVAYVYSMIKKGVPGEGWKKGAYYGSFVFLLASVPFVLTTYLLVNLPAMLLVYWTVFSLIIDLIGGALIAKIVG